MASTQLSMLVNLTFALQATTNFGANTTSPVSETFNPQNINLTNLSEVFAAEYTIFVTAPTSLAASLASGGSLTASTTYYYKVSGIGPNGTAGTIESGPSNEASATPSGGNLTINLTWTALQGATSYKIYRGTGAGLENLLVGTSTTTSFSDTGFAGSSASLPSAPNNYVEFSLSSFTDLAGNAVTAGHVFALFILPSGTGAQCTLAPGSSNGLNWPLAASSSDPVAVNGVFFQAEDPAGTGVALTGSHNTLRITNGGSNTLTAIVIAPVGP